jgi:hypothetical protein
MKAVRASCGLASGNSRRLAQWLMPWQMAFQPPGIRPGSHRTRAPRAAQSERAQGDMRDAFGRTGDRPSQTLELVEQTGVCLGLRQGRKTLYESFDRAWSLH